MNFHFLFWGEPEVQTNDLETIRHPTAPTLTFLSTSCNLLPQRPYIPTTQFQHPAEFSITNEHLSNNHGGIHLLGDFGGPFSSSSLLLQISWSMERDWGHSRRWDPGMDTCEMFQQQLCLTHYSEKAASPNRHMFICWNKSRETSWGKFP